MDATARPATAAERLVLALDVETVPAADALVQATRDHVLTYKIGARLFTAVGPRAVERVLAAGGRVFLDLKYHDIPHTVAQAVAAAAALGVTWITVHAAGGRAMVAAAAQAAREGPGGPGGAGVLAVTVLTSLDADDLASVGVSGDLEAVVLARARLSVGAGAAGLVCSPREVAAVRRAVGPGPLIVTPGIRPAGSAPADQKRAATPAAALAAGADFVVVGRPVTEASDPGTAAAAVIAELGRPP